MLFLIAIGMYLVGSDAQTLVEGTLVDAHLLAEVLKKKVAFIERS